METKDQIYDVHIFVCTNQRESPRTGCGDLGSMDLVQTLKEEIGNRRLQSRFRVNKSGCLDQCSKGPAIVLYPKGKWFFHVQRSDIPSIVDEISKY